MNRPDDPDRDLTRPIDPPPAPSSPPPSPPPPPPSAPAAPRTDPSARPPSFEQDPTVVSGWAEPGEHAHAVTPSGEGAPRSRGRRFRRGFVIWLVGAVVGFAAAFVVVALGTGDPTDGELAAEQRIAELEAELEQRDAQLADLEAQLAEAEAAAGAREEDIEAQRRALDERTEVLDEWAQTLAVREADVAEREAELAARQGQLEELRRQVEDASDVELPEVDLPDLDLPELPDVDDGLVDTIVERVLEQLREWFG